MGRNNYISITIMRHYSKSYPNLTHLLGVVSVGLTENELKGLVKREVERQAALKLEIIRSLEESNFSWVFVLNHPEIGEVIDAETEEEAREFAIEMFLKPAMSYISDS